MAFCKVVDAILSLALVVRSLCGSGATLKLPSQHYTPPVRDVPCQGHLCHHLPPADACGMAE
eukprot:4701147-Amphidinium_carterae.1